MGKRYRLLPTFGFIVALGIVGVFASLATADGDAKTSGELERALVVKPKDGKLAKPSGRKAFIVAADDYGANATALPGARNDGEAFYKRLLEIGFEEENVVFLRSGGGFADYPTKANIEKRFQTFIENLRPDDFAIVYLTGHGIQPTDSDEAFFAPIDVEPNRPFETAVSLDAMLTALEECEAKFRWVIVDACRNDPRNPERAIFTTRATGARALTKIENAPDSVALMQSCQPGACAYEGGVGEAREIESGFFTLGLLEALDPEESKADANRDGVLSFSETFQYVSTRTNELATKYYGKSQKPSLSGSIVDFALLDGLLIDGLTRTDWERANELIREARELRFDGRYDDAMKKIDAALRIKSDDKELETAKKEIAEILKNRAEAERARREAQEKAQAALDAANVATKKAEAALRRAEQAGADAVAKAEAEREAREAAEAKKRAEEALAELNAEENETSVEVTEEPNSPNGKRWSFFDFPVAIWTAVMLTWFVWSRLFSRVGLRFGPDVGGVSETLALLLLCVGTGYWTPVAFPWTFRYVVLLAAPIPIIIFEASAAAGQKNDENDLEAEGAIALMGYGAVVFLAGLWAGGLSLLEAVVFCGLVCSAWLMVFAVLSPKLKWLLKIVVGKTESAYAAEILGVLACWRFSAAFGATLLAFWGN